VPRDPSFPGLPLILQEADRNKDEHDGDK
jgi:hypothetical protein